MGILSVGDSRDNLSEGPRSPSLSPGKSVMASKPSDIHIPSPHHAMWVASSERFEKSGLVAAQQAALHDSGVLEMGYHMSEAEYPFMPEGATLKNPSIGSVTELKALKPIRLRSLKIGKVHRGRILSGTLCCKTVKTSAVMNVLEEDGTGDSTRLLIANAVPRSATTAQAQRLYPSDAQLSIREPYLKRFSDGMVGILVDNPADIIFNYLPEEIPSPEPEKVVQLSIPFSQRHQPYREGQDSSSSQVVATSSSCSSSPPSYSPLSVQSAADDHECSFLADSHDGEDDLGHALRDLTVPSSDNRFDSTVSDHPRTDAECNSPRRTDASVAEEDDDHLVATWEEDRHLPQGWDSKPEQASGEIGPPSTVQQEEEEEEEEDGEWIKSVVEESVEISLAGRDNSHKDIPEECIDARPTSIGDTSEGCVSPHGERSVEKGVISVDAKTNGGSRFAPLSGAEELTAAGLRLQGNKHFARQDWAGAIELYTRALLKAVHEGKENTSPNREPRSADQPSNEPESEVVMDYSNRAEAWLRLHHYEKAWADAERALSLDPNHLKSLFRKGRALFGLGDYQQALAHLEAAYARAPFDKDLLAAIQVSRIGDQQSRLGIFDLTDYHLRGRFVGEKPTFADYVGPVQVRTASGEKGRGLFLTRSVESGTLLLVSNPLALVESKSGSKGRKNVLDHHSTKGCLRFDVEAEERLAHSLHERAKVSNKNRQRLLALCHEERTMPVPSMDLFIPGRRIAQTGTPDLDEAHIHRIIARNAIDRNMVSIPLENRLVFHREATEDHAEDRSFCGLWVLPSFINHSCIPNASMVVIGRALFVYASRDLSAGEEILCGYSNVFQPLPQRREIASKCWGFSCRCSRCLLETRFESSLKKLYSLHTRLEPNPTFVLQFSPFGYKAPAKDLAKELEVIETSKKLDSRERSWLQASFTQLYTVSRDFMGPHGNHPYLEAAVRAMELVCPGSSSTLDVGLLARETVRKEFHGTEASQYKAVNQQVLRICQCIYGRQKTVVLQSLVDGCPIDVTTKA